MAGGAALPLLRASGLPTAGQEEVATVSKHVCRVRQLSQADLPESARELLRAWRGRAYQAVCACGWHGWLCRDLSDARWEARTHRLTGLEEVR
jgi:hypothetical protein